MTAKTLTRIAVGAPLVLAACASATTTARDGGQGLPPLPEAVVALADPGQNLATARLLPEDNCYWYEHLGQVETTLLPLRTPDGRPICVVSPTDNAG